MGWLRLFFAREAAGQAEPRNLAEFLEGYVGVLHSGEKVPGGAGMSEVCGEKLMPRSAISRRWSGPSSMTPAGIVETTPGARADGCLSLPPGTGE